VAVDRSYRQRKPHLWWLLVLLALVAAACGGGAEDSGQAGGDAQDQATEGEAAEGGETAAEGEASGDLEPLTFLLTNERSIQYHPIYVAEELGYFEEEGLDVTIEIVDGSSAAMQQLIAGNGDIALPSAPAVVQTVVSGRDVAWFYTYFYQNVFELAASADSGVQSLEDLRGRAIGISEASGGEVPLVRGVMAGAGMAEGADYQMLPVGEGGQLTFQALEAGDVDAYSSSVFDVAAVEAAGLDLVPLLPDDFRFMPSQGLVATQEVFDERTDAMAGFARAQAKAKVWADTNPEAARAITEEVQPELFEDPAFADAIWDATQRLFTPPEELEADVEETLGLHWEPGWEFYLDFISQGTEEEGAINRDDFDLEATLDDSLLEQINDFDRDAVIEDAESQG
jgi:NitT/TauT family transport system substrate-binding protein